MKTFAASAALLGALLTVLGEAAYVRVYPDQISTNVEIALAATHAPVRAVDPSAVVEQYCVRCHNERRMTGNLTLEGFETESAHEMAEIAEKMILKLRAGMMPPPGAMRPEGDSLQALAEMLEAVIDAAAAADPNPGTRRFQRLNRPEYERVIRDLLDLEIDAGRWLTADTYLGNFDNLSAAQGLLPEGGDGSQSPGGGQLGRAVVVHEVQQCDRSVAARMGPHRGHALRHAWWHGGDARLPGGR